MLKSGFEGSSFSDVQEPQCVIVGPTRELVLQIRDQACKFAYGTMIRPVVVYGGTSVQAQLREVFKGTHIVIGTPGRLLDFVEKGKVSVNIYILILEMHNVLGQVYYIYPRVMVLVSLFHVCSVAL